jgi:hypothetical protein
VAFDELHMDTEYLKPEEDNREEKAEFIIKYLISMTNNIYDFQQFTTAYLYRFIHKSIMSELGASSQNNIQNPSENIPSPIKNSSSNKRKVSFFTSEIEEPDGTTIASPLRR